LLDRHAEGDCTRAAEIGTPPREALDLEQDPRDGWSMIPPPTSLEQLLRRALALDGLSLGELSARLGLPAPPDDSRRCKGRAGELIEQALGASSGSLDQPDFPALGVELKSIPIDALGRVRESTFVCSIDLAATEREEWEGSRVWRKLARVLFVPVQAAAGIPPAARRLGTPRLWRPSDEEQRVLRADWCDLSGRIAVGGIDEIDARLGAALQIRPKARRGSERTAGRGPEGELLPTVPRGFYLRARFTERVLWSLSEP
jgi:DNA mismatch repair protein MutH